jgi:hypothetical protein
MGVFFRLAATKFWNVIIASGNKKATKKYKTILDMNKQLWPYLQPHFGTFCTPSLAMTAKSF